MRKRFILALTLILPLVVLAACTGVGTDPVKFRLTIASVGQGAVSPSQGEYPAGALVPITINPAIGWSFNRWEGNNRYEVSQGQGNNWQILMNGNKGLVAIFSREEDPCKHYSLDIKVLGKGSVYPSSGFFKEGERLELEVKPEFGWSFDSWQGASKDDVIRNDGTFLLFMDSDKSLLAIFQEQFRQLKIKIEGKGRVVENLLEGEYPSGSLLKLTAFPDYGWGFKEWKGDERGYSEVLYLVLDRDKEITAVFLEQENNYNLTLVIEGQGKVEERLVNDEYRPGSFLELLALPASGWQFANWSGDLKGNKVKAYIEMDEDKTVIAKFTKEQTYYLDINCLGGGTVVIQPDLDEFEAGTIVSLEAQAHSGWFFASWSGDLKGNKAKTNLEMDGDKYIEAIFKQEVKEEEYFVEIRVEGQGNVLKEPDKDYYREGERLSLTANADPGWEFQEWRDDARGSDRQIDLTVNDNIRVRAVFKEIKVRYSLNINIQGNGTVTKNPDYSDYEEGTPVTLLAKPTSGWQFNGWSGDASGSNSTTTVVMDAPKNVMASFIQGAVNGYPINIEINLPEKGGYTKNPDKEFYQKGERVTLTACTIGNDSYFLFWSIDWKQYEQQSITITVNGPVTGKMYFRGA